MINRRLLLRSLIVGAGLVFVCSSGATAEATLSSAAQTVEVRASRIANFEKANPSRKRFGRLQFRGGLVLTSDNDKFGGLSDLIVAADGRRFTAVTDEGNWLAGEIVFDRTEPVGLANVRLGRLLAMSGRVLERKPNSDAEGMALLSGDLTHGTMLIAFERNHRIGKFPVRNGAISAPTGYIKLPAEAQRMKRNSGLEAVAVLQGGLHQGSILAIAERLTDPEGNHTGWLWVKDMPRRIAIRDVKEFDITSAAALPDGAIIILERRFRWAEGVKMRLRHLKVSALAQGAPIEGETLFEADMSYEIDNMEGLAVHKGAQGETVLTLVSDNNFNTALQRTLLLQFTLLAEGSTDASAR
jgi:hypothetical protein